MLYVIDMNIFLFINNHCCTCTLHEDLLQALLADKKKKKLILFQIIKNSVEPTKLFDPQPSDNARLSLRLNRLVLATQVIINSFQFTGGNYRRVITVYLLSGVPGL